MLAGGSSPAVLLERDLTTGTTYYVLDEDAPIARTVHVDDLIMVDVDDQGRPLGIEIVGPLLNVEQAWSRLIGTFPALVREFPHAYALKG
jgi:uncharacterized protein YuzE